MADRTVRAIFEARVSGARKGMVDLAKDVAGAGKKVDGLTKDLKTLDAAKVEPTVEVKIDEAKKRLSDLTVKLAELKRQPATFEVEAEIEKAKAALKETRAEIKELNGQRVEVQIDASVKDAKKRLADLTVELGRLRTLEASPEVDADIKAAQRSMRAVRTELRELNAARAEMKVTADTSPAEKAVDDLADDVGDAGRRGGVDAGLGMVKGILAALVALPIAGAIIGVGQAIAEGLLEGIKDGFAIEAERDLFSAQTGLDEGTSARFGRAAGEAYANAWGESVAANLDTARIAMQAGIIDSDATDAEIENVIAKLTGITDLFDYDVTMAVQGVGNLLKTGLVKDADQAFDLIVAAQQKIPSDDLLETLNEYSNQFATLGIEGPEAFGLIVQGAKAGARDTDKVADTLKEMGLRIREGTKPATDALKLLGLNSRDMVKAFQKGGPDAAAAIDTVFDALRDLEAKGGNTQAVIAALFGGPGEDLGAALYALDVEKAADALDGVEGSAGAADRALTTMSDNTATKMEEAKRNVETAMDGIKGALAEAFGDEIGGAADWVSRNRGPMMEFMLAAVNGTLDIAEGFAELGATALDTIADMADGFADLIDALPQWLVGGEDASDGLRRMATGARSAADDIRETVPAALEDVRASINGWAAPELLKAKVHDATIAMTDDMDAFSEKVKESGGTVTINGDKLSAEEALDELIANIDGQDGTVLINGDKVPAEDALDELIALINVGSGEIEVGANTDPAEVSAEEARGRISRSEASIYVTADLSPAERELREFKAKLKKLGIRVSGVTSVGGVHEGGWTGRIAPGLHAGGRVPGHDPGYDNILWPLNSGGRTLAQPLAGDEYVVNSKDAAYWAPVLEWMNSGGRPQPTSTSNDNRTVFEKLVVQANDPGEMERKLRRAVAARNNRRAS